MFFLDNPFVEIIVLAVSICWMSVGLAIIIDKYTVHGREKSLEKAGTHPTGSCVQHGMIRNHNKGIGVISDSQKSDNWFRRLIA